MSECDKYHEEINYTHVTVSNGGATLIPPHLNKCVLIGAQSLLP
jgi:hypothetical protein